MPELTTTYFGTIRYQPECVVRFPLGLPGFEDQQRFLLIEQELNKPIVFLQSVGRPDLCFIALPTALVTESYELILSPEDLVALGLAETPAAEANPDVLCLALVTLNEDKPATANLLSPVVINWRRHLGVQPVPSDSPYSHQHPIAAGRREALCS